jgi:CRISPR-associated protein Cmr6
MSSTTLPDKTIDFIALPVSTSQLVKQHSSTHPGLARDKYPALLAWHNKQLLFQIEDGQRRRNLEKTARILTQGEELRPLWQQRFQQRQQMLTLTGAQTLSLSLVAPLTLESAHLDVHENTGLILHPLYGFVYFPGQLLKGLTRAWAENHWVPAQEDTLKAQQTLDHILGRPGQENGSGAIVFHEAWPENWPTVTVDVASQHTPHYYAGKSAAGDWQEPAPTFFLALQTGARFQFALSRNGASVAPELLNLAQEWLSAALHQGLGQRRSSGYGRFGSAAAADLNATLELATPAFLAGASQKSGDCQLRGPHLRGLLRWWWRTLHSGHLNRQSLLALETALWGNHNQPGALALALQPEGLPQARRFRKQERTAGFPRPQEPKTAQGLWYLAHGMDSPETQRLYLDAGTRWNLQIQAQPATFTKTTEQGTESIVLSAEQVQAQASAALWLLTRFGGVGARQRKGFGSLQPLEHTTLDTCLADAEALRQHCGFNHPFTPAWAEIPSLQQCLEFTPIQTAWKNPWFALDQLGASLQAFARQHKHQALKKALGLPREIGEPVEGTFEPGRPVRNRFSSPALFRLTPSEKGYLFTGIAFPAPKLPNFEASKQLLSELLAFVTSDLATRTEQFAQDPEPKALEPRKPRRKPGENAEAPRSEKRAPRPERKPFGRPYDPNAPRQEPKPFEAAAPSGGLRERKPRPPREDNGPRREGRGGPRRVETPARPTHKYPQAGDRVEAVLLEEKTKKGGWKAQHPGSKLSGPLLNPGLVPSELSAGSSVTLIVHASNSLEMMFRWPTAADEEKAAKGKRNK